MTISRLCDHSRSGDAKPNSRAAKAEQGGAVAVWVPRPADGTGTAISSLNGKHLRLHGAECRFPGIHFGEPMSGQSEGIAFTVRGAGAPRGNGTTHEAAGALGARHSLRPLRAELPGKPRALRAARRIRISGEYERHTLPAFIARLDRATQYSETSVIEPRSRGGLDTQHSAGHDEC